jgi:ABC-type oligopeptide transport system substrate-binding subunit
MTELTMELYDALKEAGVSDERARAAARTTAVPDSLLQALRAELNEIKIDLRHNAQDVPALRTGLQSAMADIAVMKWQIGAIIGLLLLLGVPMLWLVLKISLKLGVLSL